MKTIFDQETLGKQNLKNRIIRSATWMATADEGGLLQIRSSIRIMSLHREMPEELSPA